MPQKRSVYYINEKKKTASSELAHLLRKCISTVDRQWDEILFICIGSDRITGDSLGPLIGQQLSKYHWRRIFVYGTLDAPVHALNLEETMDKLKKKHPAALTVAIDASLGSKKHVGFITVGTGPICPGSGVHKKLPPVGDLFITGILNVSGAFEHLTLQTTRLCAVMQMAETITAGITKTLDSSYAKRRLLPEGWFQRAAERDASERRLNWAKVAGLAAFSNDSDS